MFIISSNLQGHCRTVETQYLASISATPPLWYLRRKILRLYSFESFIYEIIMNRSNNISFINKEGTGKTLFFMINIYTRFRQLTSDFLLLQTTTSFCRNRRSSFAAKGSCLPVDEKNALRICCRRVKMRK